MWAVIKGNPDSPTITIDIVLQVSCLAITIFLYICCFLQFLVDTIQGHTPKESRDFFAIQMRTYRQYVKERLLTPPPVEEGDEEEFDVDGIELIAYDPATSSSPGVGTGSGAGAFDEFDKSDDAHAASIEAEKLAYVKAKLLERKAAEKRAKRFEERTSIVAHWKAMWYSFKTRTNPDAFFFPQRVFTAMFISLAALTLFFVTFYNYAVNLRNDIMNGVAGAAVENIFVAIIQLEQAIYQNVGVDVNGGDIQFAYGQASTLQTEGKELADAAYKAYMVGCSIGYFLVFLSWAIHLGAIRMQVMLARTDRWQIWYGYDKYEDATVGYTVYYVSNIVYNCLFVWALFTIVLWFIFTAFLWQPSCDFIFSWKVWSMLLKTIAPSLTNTILILLLYQYIVTHDTLLYRKIWVSFDAFECVIGVVAAPLDICFRLIYAIIFLLIGFMRMEHSLAPAWVEHLIIKLDKPAKVTAAVVKMAHTHQNPAAWCFISCLYEDKPMPCMPNRKKDDEETVIISELEASSAVVDAKNLKNLVRPRDPYKVTRNRLWLWVLLSKNPSLRQYRKHVLWQTQASWDLLLPKEEPKPGLFARLCGKKTEDEEEDENGNGNGVKGADLGKDADSEEKKGCCSCFGRKAKDEDPTTGKI
jgi:hypothetical protein